MKHFSEYLNSNGIRPSLQRLKIYEYLYTSRNHPTADTIYTALAPHIPTLSKTTVYNTLKLFVLKGVAVVVNIEDHEARYDADTSVHGHMKCKGCGQLFDISLTAGDFRLNRPDGFTIDEMQIYMKGYCKVCNPNKSN
ncbi:Fur family transcriptional regulator [Roseimarinus sediminis]|uniref:Fur family transcriptional regulator n=1 Tax=Roseimarinus sediminis TaxID=1610899 RepID=UPI003D243415